MITLALRYWWAIVIALLLAALGAEHIRANHHKTAFAEFRLEVVKANAKAAEAFRKEEQRRQAAADEEAQNARDEIKLMEGDVLRAADVADGVRDELAAFKRRAAARACAPIGGQGKPDTAALDMLSELYARADREAGELAIYADRLRIAGSACERTADAIAR